jgi:hypothetical protein
MSRILLLAACLLSGGAPAAFAQTTFPIHAYAAYLHVDPSDATLPAVPIDLGALGLAPGYTIRLECAGDWNAGPGGDVQTNLLVVFSSTPTLLGPAERYRVPGAVSAGLSNDSGNTWPSGQPTDIPEDFLVGRPGVTLVIPATAKFLFATTADIYYRDNSDPDGDLGVTLTLVSTTAVPGDGAPVDATLALAARPNPFTAETSIAFRLGEAATVRLAVHDATGRRVRTLLAETLAAGNHVARWDGRDDAGRLAAAGSYYARLEGGGLAGTTRLIALR